VGLILPFEHAELRKSKIVRLTIVFSFLSPTIFAPLLLSLVKTLPPATLLKLGAGLPFFTTNLEFLMRSPQDNEGLAVAITVSSYSLLTYSFAMLMMVAVLISREMRNECLFFVLVIHSSLSRERKLAGLIIVTLYSTLAAQVLLGWECEVIFGAMHVHSNSSNLRVLLSTIQLMVYGFSVSTSAAILVGEVRYWSQS
jgi:hypothetical protein